jgi:hypothetical protein
LIDQLVDFSFPRGSTPLYSPDDRYRRVVALGFAAVPALINHLDDDRLTRATIPAFRGSCYCLLRIRHLAAELIRGLAGDDLGLDWHRKQEKYGLTKAEAEPWWDRARICGEEGYLLDHVLVQNEFDRHRLQVIVAKYPQHLPELYRESLFAKCNRDTACLVDALVEAKLPAREMVELLMLGAQAWEYRHRLAALTALKDIDRAQFSKALIATIESFPKDVSPHFGGWHECCEAYIAELALNCDDPKVWEALTISTQRAGVELRMEILHGLGHPVDQRHHAEQLVFLAQFLNDTTTSNPIPYGSRFDVQIVQIEIRNYVVRVHFSLAGAAERSVGSGDMVGTTRFLTP